MSKTIKGGLRPLPKDRRDFSHNKVFGTIEEVPDIDFVVAEPKWIEDQQDSDYCTGYSSSSVSEDQEDVDLCPIFSFAAIKSIDGKPDEWGSDLRSACKAAVKVGFLEKKDSPYTVDDKRETVVYLSNWPKGLIEKALDHKKESYFRVDEGEDIFELMRRALWQHKNKKCSISTGTTWRKDWTLAKGGIIPNFPSHPLVGHALKIFGQKIIMDEPYLMTQLSNGEGIGDKGIFYFSREIINRDFKFGAFMFIDMPQEEARRLAWSIWRRILERIRKYIKSLWNY